MNWMWIFIVSCFLFCVYLILSYLNSYKISKPKDPIITKKFRCHTCNKDLGVLSIRSSIVKKKRIYCKNCWNHICSLMGVNSK